MTLKDTISKWHGAICLLEQGHPKEAMLKLMEIDNPSAKIVYNLGCISMKMDLYTDAIEYFTTSLEQDKYLAISYFQRGVCFYKIRSFSSAERDFEKAKSMVPSEGIDYRQLGAKVILLAKMIDGYSRLCRHYTETNMPAPVQTSSVDFIFYPPKGMVANLKKEDFLGKAKVISSVQESDILYAESKGPKEKPPKKSAVGGVKSTLSASMQQLSSTLGRPALPPSRPPPRRGPDRCLSTGDLLDSGIDTDETDSSSGAQSLAVPTTSNDHHLHKRQSAGDNYDYSHVTQEVDDSFSNYTRLSVSSSVLDQKPVDEKPVVPERPVARPIEDVKKDNAFVSNGNNNIHIKPPLSPDPRFEFQKIHEALKLKGKFSDKALNIDKSGSPTAKHQHGKPTPIVLRIDHKSQEEINKLVPRKRILTQSQPNLSQSPVPNSLHSHVNGASNAHKSPSAVVKPTRPVPVPRKSPDRTLDNIDKPKPPPRPPPPRK